MGGLALPESLACAEHAPAAEIVDQAELGGDRGQPKRDGFEMQARPI